MEKWAWGNRQGREVRKYYETDRRIVGFALFMGFVKRIAYCHPYRLVYNISHLQLMIIFIINYFLINPLIV